MTTGAADTVRKATQKAKGTARKARGQAETAAGQASAATLSVAEDVTDAAQETAAEAATRVEEAVGELGDELAIAGYDDLSVEQILPKLKPLSADELAAVDGYERGGRSRKRVLDRIAALRSKKVDEQLAQL
jgi:hypothetical protein